jgi:alpha-tubulin suppressor-like RCC1 family protein
LEREMFITPNRPHTRRAAFGAAVRSTAGAIDLASIMVGIIVIGVIAGTIAATVFAVIPWSQDAAARQGLDSVRTAEAVNQVQASQFTDFSGLRTANLIQTSTTVSAAIDAEGTCYVAVSKSSSGAVFLSTDVSPDVVLVTSATTTACLTPAALQTLLQSIDGAAASTPAAAARFVQTVAGGYGHTVAIDKSGKLWSWGFDGSGQLGNDAAYTDKATPVAVLSDRTFTQVAANDNHTVALDSTGKLWSWGSNYYGQLGNDAVLTNTATPVAVLSDRTFTQVAAGMSHTVALDSTGKLWSWGGDALGQLGNDAALTNQATPVAVLSDRTFTQVTAGGYHTVALDNTNKLWSWGRDNSGQLGNDAALTNQATPVAVLSDRTFTQVVAGSSHTVALDSTGKLWSWGNDGFGQLGNDTALTAQATPVAVLSDRTFTQVFAGISHTVALDSTDRLWSWGDDGAGQLGNDAALTAQATPVAVLSDRTFTQVAAGDYHTLALDSTGKLWSWGNDGFGQLGNDAALTRQATPVAVFGW